MIYVMAGRHRTYKPGERAPVLVKLPVALKIHLQDEALRHKRSLNAEILDRLMPNREQAQRVRDQLLEMEPNPRSDREIADDMARVKGQSLPEDSEDDEFADVEIDWIPGTAGERWNESARQDNI